MENCNGLAVAARVTEATGTAERDAAKDMVANMTGRHRITLGADKAFDTRDFVDDMRKMRVTPHVAQNTSGRRSRIDGRTTRHSGYAVSQRIRKRIEEIFGWVKATGGLRKTRHRGVTLVGWMFTLTVAAYNVVRIPKNRHRHRIGAPDDRENPPDHPKRTEKAGESRRVTTSSTDDTADQPQFFSSLLVQ
jgi:hypothetical protein